MKHVGNCRLRGYLTHLVTSSQEDLYRRNSPRMSGNLHCFFLDIFVKQQEISQQTARWQKHWMLDLIT